MTVTKATQGRRRGFHELWDQNENLYMEFSSDHNASDNGPTIHNLEGDIDAICAEFACTDGGGTSPTAQMILQGSLNNSDWFTVPDSGGTSIQTSAEDISSADTTTVVAFVDTMQEGRNGFPPYLRLRLALGGTSPTADLKMYVAVRRGHGKIIQS